MSINLSKGGNVDLSKAAPGVTEFSIGLGWNPNRVPGVDFDLDAAAYLIGADGKVSTDANFVFFNNQTSPCGSVKLSGDNKTGAGEGDDEVIKVNTATLPADVEKVAITINIFDGVARGQTFGQVQNAYIHITDTATGVEIARFDLAEDASTDVSSIFGELYKLNGAWKFRNLNQSFPGGLSQLAASFGVHV